MSDWTENGLKIVESLDVGEFNERQPIPYIRDLTTTGVLSIGWDRPMSKPKKTERIRPSRVAVQNRNSTDEDPYSIKNPGFVEAGDRRRLEFRYFKNMVNEEIDPEWYLIVESLEIKTRAGLYSEPQYLNLTWELLSYDEQLIFI